MGNGNRVGNLLNFQLTANYDMNADDLGRWQRAFSKASELLWNATEGQLRFGTIWVAENNAGINNAEFVLDPNVAGRALATFGKWGQPGEAIQLPAYTQRQVLSIIHELGHHLFALDEEYARAEGAEIDTGASLPAGHNNQIIPLVATDLNEPDANYAGASAIMVFAGQPVETQTITSKVGNRINVSAPFSANPQTNSSSWFTIQWTTGVECTGDRSTGACIMEFSRSSAGNLAADGTWTPAAQPVTEFCTEDNHDPDTDTGQESRYMEPCWDTIMGAAGFTDLGSGAPDPSGPASTTEPAGWSAPTWTVLDPNVRLALVLDRSGSMNRNGGARLTGVKTGAQFWIENAAVENDQLTIVWYNSSTLPQLDLTEVGTLDDDDVQDQVDLIEARDAVGGTNIVGGLDEALAQLTAPGNPASVQASLLITDGAHNTPPGTAMSDVIPGYAAANTNIHTLGVGSGGEMDLPGLTALATNTGGTAQTAGNGNDAAAIQNALIEINAVIRGGMVSADGSGGGDSRKADDSLDRFFDEAMNLEPEERPKLEELTANFNVPPLEKLLGGEVENPHRFVWFGVEVEEDVRSTTFTLSHGKGAHFWMYLIDPDGREVHPSDGDVVAWKDSSAPYEFAKIAEPTAGQWTVVGLRLDRGVAVPTKAIAAIEHPEVSAHASAAQAAHDCPVVVTAGARFLEPLTGLRVNAVVESLSGSRRRRFALYDSAADGVYTAALNLPDGSYTGYVELRSPRDPLVANLAHAILHAEDPKEVGEPRVKAGPFLRHVPISFTVGPVKVPDDNFPEDERRGGGFRPPRDIDFIGRPPIIDIPGIGPRLPLPFPR